MSERAANPRRNPHNRASHHYDSNRYDHMISIDYGVWLRLKAWADKKGRSQYQTASELLERALRMVEQDGGTDG